MTIKEKLNGLEGVSKRKAQVEVGKELLRMLNAGMTNSEIAKETGLSESSIRSLRSHHEELEGIEAKKHG